MAHLRDPYLLAIGRLVGNVDLMDWRMHALDVGGTEPRTGIEKSVSFYFLDALDAVADLLTAHARTRVRHNRDLRDESIGAQRDASDAYATGLRDGITERNHG